MYIVILRKIINDKHSIIAKEFKEFEEAYQYMRTLLIKESKKQNSLFDGNGSVINLDNFLDLKEWEKCLKEKWDETDAEIYESYKTIKKIVNSVLSDCPLAIKNFEYDDCYIKTRLNNNKFYLYGHEEGPDNGIDPKIRTNLFTKSKSTKHYYFHLIDLFSDEQEYVSELYLDMICSK